MLEEQIHLDYCFQPIYNCRTERIDSAEILLRVKEYGHILNTEKFLERAEKDSFTDFLDLYILEKACIYMRELSAHGIYQVHTNFAPATLCAPGIEKQMKEILKKYQIKGSKICIEITEQSCDRTILNQILKKLKKDGLVIAIDDFGKDHSDMRRLFDFPYDIAKIDKEIVKEMEQDERKQNLVKNLIRFFHDSQIEVVAEGIENADTFRMLRDWDCDKIQGYYISKPVSYHEFLKLF